MKTLKIEIPKGYEVDKQKSTFENIVFKEIASPMDEVYRYNATTEEQFDKKYEGIEPYIKAIAKEYLIVNFYNKGVLVDFNNSSQRKYYPYFYMDNFWLRSLCYDVSSSNMPSRFCFLRKEDCEGAVEKFFDVYKESRNV